MRALVQRVNRGSVRIGGRVHAESGAGFVILLGIRKGDTQANAASLAERCANLRVFEDEQGKMNLSLKDVGGSALVVSQFTLYADTRKGNRPGFGEAAPPGEAETLYDVFVQCLRSLIGERNVSTGLFRASMEVTIVNEGPVTILLETRPEI
jgi:D-tyrosyl-tRNA(Tyr) deacylase